VATVRTVLLVASVVLVAGLPAPAVADTVTAAQAPLPYNSDPNSPSSPLTSVSCVAPGSCVAVGTFGDNANGQQALLVTRSPGSRSAAYQPPPPVNAAANPAANPDAVLESASCASAGNCAAVGD